MLIVTGEHEPTPEQAPGGIVTGSGHTLGGSGGGGSGGGLPAQIAPTPSFEEQLGIVGQPIDSPFISPQILGGSGGGGTRGSKQVSPMPVISLHCFGEEGGGLFEGEDKGLH